MKNLLINLILLLSQMILKSQTIEFKEGRGKDSTYLYTFRGSNHCDKTYKNKKFKVIQIIRNKENVIFVFKYEGVTHYCYISQSLELKEINYENK